jgi:acetyltransferase
MRRRVAALQLDFAMVAETIGRQWDMVSGHRTRLERSAILPSGQSIRIRPPQPEDHSLFVEFGSRMAPEDLRLRFFTTARTLTDNMMARLVHIDHTRDAALVAQALDSEEILGVAS